MKTVISIAGIHYLLPVDVAIQFGRYAQQVDRRYNGDTGYDYHQLAEGQAGEIEIRFIDEKQIKEPYKP